MSIPFIKNLLTQHQTQSLRPVGGPARPGPTRPVRAKPSTQRPGSEAKPSSSVSAITITVLMIGLLTTPFASATTLISEDFDTEVTFETSPTGTGYTYTVGGSGTNLIYVSTDQHSSGTKSLLTQGISSGGQWPVMNVNAGDLCVLNSDTVFLNFYLRLTGFTQTQSFFFGFASQASAGAGTTDGSLGLRIDAGGIPKFRMVSGNGATASTLSFPGMSTMSTNTWYNIDISSGCATTSGNSRIAITGGGVTTFQSCNTCGNLNGAVGGTDTLVFGSFTSQATSNDYFIDTINAGTGTPDTSPPIGSIASTTITGGVGFDVDATGNLMIASTEGGANVRTYPASSLVMTAIASTGGCSGKVGFAIETHVAYPHCSSGTRVDKILIRSSSLVTPTRPGYCDGSQGNFCATDLTNGELVNPGGNNPHVFNAITDFPINYARQERSNTQVFCSPGETQCRIVYVAFAWIALGGNIGVSTIALREAATDVTSYATASVGAQTADQLCVARDLDGKDYIYASTSLSAPQGYIVTFQRGTGSNSDAFIPTITNIFPGTPSTANALGIACSEQSHFAILNTNKITIWECRTSCSSPIYTVTFSGTPPLRGITYSQDGEWIAYVLGSTWYVICGDQSCPLGRTAGQEVAHGTIPSGTFQGIQLDGHANNVWVGTDTTVALYQIYQQTTGNETAYIPPCNGETCTNQTSGATSGGQTVEGTGCLEHYSGPVIIGKTYVPIEDWTNCAAMAFQTFWTIIFALVIVGLILKWAGAGGRTAMGILTVVSFVAYILSMYIWQAPGWPVVVLVILAIAGIFIARNGG